MNPRHGSPAYALRVAEGAPEPACLVVDRDGSTVAVLPLRRADLASRIAWLLDRFDGMEPTVELAALVDGFVAARELVTFLQGHGTATFGDAWWPGRTRLDERTIEALEERILRGMDAADRIDTTVRPGARPRPG